MTPAERAHQDALAADTIAQEAERYTAKKPRRVPPAESPTRPALASLWAAGQAALARRPLARQFVYEGTLYAFIAVGGRRCVFRVKDAMVLVGDSAP